MLYMPYNYYCHGNRKVIKTLIKDNDCSEEKSLEVYSYVTINCIIYCYHGDRSYHSNKQLQWIQKTALH